MKRGWIYGLILISAFALLGAALGWILVTESGTRWFFERVSRGSSSKIEVRGIHGRLLETVRLDGLRITEPDAEIRAQTILLRWQPLHLLSGKIVVTELNLDGVDVHVRETPLRRHRVSIGPCWLLAGFCPGFMLRSARYIFSKSRSDVEGLFAHRGRSVRPRPLEEGVADSERYRMEVSLRVNRRRGGSRFRASPFPC